MKAKLELELRPFTVPNFVLVDPPIKQEGSTVDSDATSYPLEAIDAETLDRMCDQFRDAVFKKAKKQQPARCYAAER